MANLDGTGKMVDLGGGYRITAPGLLGTVKTDPGRAPKTRDGGPEKATKDFDEALEAAGVNNVLTIELDVQKVPVLGVEKPIRTAQNEDALMLEVPDLGETVGQVVLAIDEDGIMTWNFPVNQQGRPETPTVRGAGGTKRFIIRRHVPQPSPTLPTEKRGLVQILGRKLLKVLVYPVTDAVLGPISAHFVGKWEEKNRPYLIRHFAPNNYLQANMPGLNPNDWKKLGEGRALLFIHGTSSTSRTGFANFPRSTLEALYHGYGGRVFAFDHFTLSVDPAENVDWFMKEFTQRAPAELSLNLDIVCHSRGGLVARTLAGELQRSALPRVHVRRIIFVATPNHGTALADPNHMTAFIDRYTTMLNLAPSGSLVAEILEALITVVKVISHAALNGLRGLAAQNPQGQFLQKLNAAGVPMDTQHYAITADFEPPKGGLRDMVKDIVANQVVDRVFERQANDLIVPTDGVYKGSQAPGFPIPNNQVLLFPPDRGVAHSYYFVQSETSVKLKEWLLT